MPDDTADGALTENDGIDIVPVDAEQAVALAPIHAASFEEAWNAPALARLLGAGAARALAAFAGYERRPLGFVLAFVAADEAEILTIAVDPALRRTGIAARLLRALHSELAQEGIGRVYLEVAADNTAALSLYRRFGFIDLAKTAE